MPALPPRVLLLRYWFKVILVDTLWRLARVVEDETFGDRPGKRLVDEIVCLMLNALKRHPAITAVPVSAWKQQATGRIRFTLRKQRSHELFPRMRPRRSEFAALRQHHSPFR